MKQSNDFFNFGSDGEELGGELEDGLTEPLSVRDEREEAVIILSRELSAPRASPVVPPEQVSLVTPPEG